MSPTPHGSSAPTRDRARAAVAEETARRRRLLLVVAGVLLAALLAVGGTVAYQAWQANRAPSAQPGGPDPTGPQPPEPGTPLVIGRPDAKHAVTVFEDAHCPHCATFESRVGEELEKAVRDGRARLELYPMSFVDEGSQRAAQALGCAAEHGHALSLHRGLWANSASQWTTEQLQELARQTAGGQAEAITGCIGTDAHAEWVASMGTAAEQLGVDSTPTMIVDGERVDTASIDGTTLAERLR